MKTRLWILILATAPVIVAGCAHVQSTMPAPASENKPAEAAVQPVKPAIQADRDLSGSQATDIAFSVIYADPDFLKFFFDTTDESIRFFLEPYFDMEAPLPVEYDSYEFTGYSDAEWSDSASRLFEVKVNRRTGEVLFLDPGTDDTFQTKDQYMKCLEQYEKCLESYSAGSEE